MVRRVSGPSLGEEKKRGHEWMPEEFELFQFGGQARASTYLGQGQRRLVGLAHKQPLQHDLVELGIGPPVEKLVQLHQELEVDVVGLWRRPAGVPPVPSSGGSQVDGHGALLCVGRGSLLTSIARLRSMMLAVCCLRVRPRVHLGRKPPPPKIKGNLVQQGIPTLVDPVLWYTRFQTFTLSFCSYLEGFAFPAEKRRDRDGVPVDRGSERARDGSGSGECLQCLC